jgi:TonB family protein
MSYQALLFCPDEKTARTVTQVLSELDFSVEAVAEPFAVVKKLMSQHFDAIVADCENEQNASLIFKSARNSTSNQSSLFVAVVEGQAGVAKAFRIGANLVLTKPINIEQSKGTLRVARGLLRKNADATKAAAPQSGAAPVPSSAAKTAPVLPTRPSQVASAQPATPARPVVAQPATPTRELLPLAPAAFAGNEIETEPEIIELDATDTAMLESLSSLQSSSPTSSESPELPKTLAHASKVPLAPSPMSSSAGTLNNAALDKLPTSKSPSAPSVPSTSPVSVGHGAAAAAAPAKEATPALVPTHATEQPAPEAQAAFAAATPVAASTTSLSPAPFSSYDSPKTESGSGSKTPLIAAAAVVIMGILGYAGYTYMHGKSAQSPSTQSAAVTSEASSSFSQQTTATIPDATVTAKPLPENNPVGTSASSTLTAKPATATQANNQKTVSANLIAEDKTVSLDKPAPLVVKTDVTHASSSKSQDQGADAAPVPLGVAMGSGNQDKALSSIVSTAPAVPSVAPQVVNISQGVSQGLLLKRVQPSYPPQAMTMRIEGAVSLQATIAKDGTIKGVKVLGGHPLLARAAADAVRQWRYKPYLLNGQPFEVQTEITVNFKLPN